MAKRKPKRQSKDTPPAETAWGWSKVGHYFNAVAKRPATSAEIDNARYVAFKIFGEPRTDNELYSQALQALYLFRIIEITQEFVSGGGSLQEFLDVVEGCAVAIIREHKIDRERPLSEYHTFVRDAVELWFKTADLSCELEHQGRELASLVKDAIEDKHLRQDVVMMRDESHRQITAVVLRIQELERNWYRKDWLAGRKSADAAARGNWEIHGSAQKRWETWQVDIDREHAKDPKTSYENLCRRVADKHGVSHWAVKRRTTNPKSRKK